MREWGKEESIDTGRGLLKEQEEEGERIEELYKDREGKDETK